MHQLSQFCAAFAMVWSSPFLTLGQPAAPLDKVRISSDNFEVSKSCVIEPGTYRIPDADGNGVLHITADDITVEFAPGAVLDGSSPDSQPDEFAGIGIRLNGHTGVTLRNARVRGYRVGAYLSDADRLVVEDADFSGNFRQRLKSTPEAEDGSDWLFGHENEKNEWMTNYGAALYVEESDSVTLRRIRVRDGQNGICIDTVNDSQIYDNDCSFLSGWGLAMWRSSRNVISRNAFDFCVRGYSHGVYNRGQDSAGIFCFEQNNDNLFAENSATHGGDCFFGFAGVAALASGERRGNNNNLLINNDFSYAPAHGIEMTFSFGNRFIGNRLLGNAICGVWGGYSQETVIALNTFESNGDMAYGAERGGVNIEHGYANRIEWNSFRNNKCGIHLWWDNDSDLLKQPWCVANEKGSADNVVTNNTFQGDALGLQVRQTRDTTFALNRMDSVAKETDVDSGSNLVTDVVLPAVVFTAPAYDAVGLSRPVGARKALIGRENIIMTEWGPWDHQRPLIVARGRNGSEHRYELLGADMLPQSGEHVRLAPGESLLPDSPLDGVRFTTEAGSMSAVSLTLSADASPARRFVIRAPEQHGIYPYSFRAVAGNLDQVISGTLIHTAWKVTFFPWSTDPREDEAAWREQASGPKAVTCMATQLNFPFASGGPSDLAALPDLAVAALPKDHFGTIASTSLIIPKGRWRLTVTSDDGVRVSVNGTMVIDNWTWHAPTRDSGEFEQPATAMATIELSHFELDGYSTLQLDLTPAQ